MIKSKRKRGSKSRSALRNIICLFTFVTLTSFGTLLFMILFTSLVLTKNDNVLVIDGLKCPAPQLKPPRSKPVKDVNFLFKDYVCAKGYRHSPVLIADGKSLRKARSTHLDANLMICTYTPFYRVINVSGIETYNFSNRKYVIKTGKNTQVASEFVKTSCISTDHDNPKMHWWKPKIKHSFFSFVSPKSLSHTTVSQDLTSDADLHVIIIMGISGVSRTQFHNFMPETTKYLMSDFHMLEYRYLHAQSLEAKENIMYLLTGNRSTCAESSIDYKNNSCRFIFEDLKHIQKYYTAIAEDCVENSAEKFGHLSNDRITDFYWNTFYHAYKDYFGETNCTFCVHNTISYELVFDYQKRFINHMEKENLRYFGYFWVNSVTNLQDYNKFIDKDYKKLFQFLRYSGMHSRSAILFLSDGAGIKSLDSSERVPFFFLYLPLWYQKLVDPSMHLIKNQKMMITYQDIYKTMLYISKLNRRFDKGLFEPVNINRDCIEANIDEDVCTC